MRCFAQRCRHIACISPLNFQGLVTYSCFSSNGQKDDHYYTCKERELEKYHKMCNKYFMWRLFWIQRDIGANGFECTNEISDILKKLLVNKHPKHRKPKGKINVHRYVTDK